MGELKIKLSAVTLDSRDPHALADFYAKLLTWVIPYENEEYAVIAPPGTRQGAYPGITFQRNPDYVPPVWPEAPDAQQQMAHLDLAVNDLEKAVEYAIQCGAKLSSAQFTEDWRVLFDPDGHPFCLCRMEHVFESPHFGLL